MANGKLKDRMILQFSVSDKDPVLREFFNELYTHSVSKVIKEMLLSCMDSGGIAQVLSEQRDVNGELIKKKLGELSPRFIEKYPYYFGENDKKALQESRGVTLKQTVSSSSEARVKEDDSEQRVAQGGNGSGAQRTILSVNTKPSLQGGSNSFD